MSVRTRVRTSKDWDSLVPLVFTLCNPPLTVPHETLPQVGTGLRGGTSYHYIVDTPDGIGYTYNPVFHEKYTALYSGCLSARDQYGRVSVQTVGKTPLMAIDLVRSLLQSNLSVELLDDFSAQSEQLFIAPLPDGSSLINLIIEIIDMLTFDIKQIQKLILSWKQAVKRFFKRLWEELKRGHGPASYWIAWRFAIRPTIKDVKNMIQSIDRARKALAWLRKVNHRVVSRHNRRQLDGFFDGCTAESDLYFPSYYGVWLDGDPPMLGIPPMKDDPTPGSLRVRCTESELKLCATANVQFDIDDALVDEGWAAVGTAWASMQWLYNPWAITWEATPFSWAVDWCLSERAKLERWKQFHECGDPYGLGVIKDSCWSLKARLQCVLEYCQPGRSPLEIGQIIYRVYSRELGLPNFGSSWLRLPFSGYQASIFAGVLDGRTRRR